MVPTPTQSRPPAPAEAARDKEFPGSKPAGRPLSSRPAARFRNRAEAREHRAFSEPSTLMCLAEYLLWFSFRTFWFTTGSISRFVLENNRCGLRQREERRGHVRSCRWRG